MKEQVILGNSEKLRMTVAEFVLGAGGDDIVGVRS